MTDRQTDNMLLKSITQKNVDETVSDVLGGGMSGGAALTLGGGGRKGGGGMLGGIGPGGKKVGILAALASASDCSEITCGTAGTERR